MGVKHAKIRIRLHDQRIKRSSSEEDCVPLRWRRHWSKVSSQVAGERIVAVDYVGVLPKPLTLGGEKSDSRVDLCLGNPGVGASLYQLPLRDGRAKIGNDVVAISGFPVVSGAVENP